MKIELKLSPSLYTKLKKKNKKIKKIKYDHLSNIVTWYFATSIHLEDRGQFWNNKKTKKGHCMGL
jgi:hypothetical protein